MKLTKLEKLSEGKMHGKLEERRVRNWFDQVEPVIENAYKAATGKLLEKMLADGGFPATESKAFVDAAKKMMGEFEDLKMAMLIPFEMDETK